MKVLRLVLALVFVLLAVPAIGQVVYLNDFQGSVGAEWSKQTTDVTPAGSRKFLGQFLTESVVLSLNSLPAHAFTTVEFDLLLIKTWDGCSMYNAPDIWDLSVVGGPELLHTTFALYPDIDPLNPQRQSYPDRYPGGNYPARTGSTENNTLGYTWYDKRLGGFFPLDAVYHLSFTFSHTDPSLGLNFSSILADDYEIGNETWGLDNVKVSVSPVPEPSSLVALACGLGGLVLRRRRT